MIPACSALLIGKGQGLGRSRCKEQSQSHLDRQGKAKKIRSSMRDQYDGEMWAAREKNIRRFDDGLLMVLKTAGRSTENMRGSRRRKKK